MTMSIWVHFPCNLEMSSINHDKEFSHTTVIFRFEWTVLGWDQTIFFDWKLQTNCEWRRSQKCQRLQSSLGNTGPWWYCKFNNLIASELITALISFSLTDLARVPIVTFVKFKAISPMFNFYCFKTIKHFPIGNTHII